MTRKLIFVLFVFVSLTFCGRTQQTRLKIDSIKIYHLPLSMRTFLALDDYEVRNWTEKIMNQDILQIHHITDASEIAAFTDAKITDTSNMIDLSYSLDVRIVIDIFMEGGTILSLIMDHAGYYIIGNEKAQRSRNRKLNAWLRKYIPDLF